MRDASLGDCEITPPIYEKTIMKDKGICTIGPLDNGLMYLNVVFQSM